MRKKGKEKNHFDMIYQAAVQQDENLLPEEPYAIDVFQPGFYEFSAVAKLASEGKQKAVGWLLEHGASINYAAFGYALGGHKKAVFDCVKNHHANVDLVAKGFAKRGDKEEALLCVEKWGADINEVAFGFAWGGHVQEAWHCVDQRRAELWFLVRGFAMGGNEAQALRSINKLDDYSPSPNFKSSHNGASFIESIVEYFALAGYSEKVQRYMKKNTEHDLFAAIGFARGGHIEEATKYADQDEIFVSLVAKGFACSGYAKQALAYVDSQDVDVNDVAKNFAGGGHSKSAFYCIDKLGADSSWMASYFIFSGFVKQALVCVEKRDADVDGIAKFLARSGYFKIERSQLFILSQLSDDKKRKELVESLKKQKVHITPAMIKRSLVIAKLMRRYGYSFSEALLSTHISKWIPKKTAIKQTTHPNPLTILVNLMMSAQKETRCCLSIEVWFNIFEHAAGQSISNSEFDKLAFLTTRLVLLSQLPKEAAALKMTILKTTDFKSLASVVHQQKDSALSENKVLLLWDKRLSGYRNDSKGKENETMSASSAGA